MNYNTFSKVTKFLLGGGVAAAVNLALMVLLIDTMGFDTPLLRNVANVASIELSLILSFFIYRLWVWPGGVWAARDVLFRQLPLYHFSAGTAVVVRIFLLFPLLDYLGVNYTLNTLIGVLGSAAINYILSDRVAFKDVAGRSDNGISVVPEGLEVVRGHIVAVGSPELVGKIKLLSLVIPAYNEEATITETIDTIVAELRRYAIPHEILIVNDNSKDNTLGVLQGLSDTYEEVRFITNYYPNGFGFAVRCGLENFSGDAVCIVMADGSDAPSDIVQYYFKLKEGYDCVFGSRFVPGGNVYDYPRHKLIINRMANKFIQTIFGLPYNDVTNAFKGYRKYVIEGVSPLISHHFNLTVEIPLKAAIRGYSYAVVPISWSNRKAGVSKLKIREMGSRYLFIVLSILLERWLARGDYSRKNIPAVKRAVGQES